MCLLAIWRNSFTTFLLTRKTITVEWKIGCLCAEGYYTAIKMGGPGLCYPCVDQSLDVGHPVFKHVFVSWCFDIWALAAPAGTVPPRASQSLERVNGPPVSSPFLCKPTSSEFTPQGPPSWGSPVLGYYPPARITPGPVTTQLGPAPYTPEPAPTIQPSQT